MFNAVIRSKLAFQILILKAISLIAGLKKVFIRIRSQKRLVRFFTMTRRGLSSMQAMKMWQVFNYERKRLELN